MTRISTATITIRDAKNKRGFFECYISHPDLPADNREDPYEYAQELAVVINNLIGGVVEDISLTLPVALPTPVIPLRTVPLPESDVQEGATFIFGTVKSDVSKKARIPTFREEFILPGTIQVDLADPVVAYFVEFMTVPEEQTADWVAGACEQRGLDLKTLREAYESFK